VIYRLAHPTGRSVVRARARSSCLLAGGEEPDSSSFKMQGGKVPVALGGRAGARPRLPFGP